MAVRISTSKFLESTVAKQALVTAANAPTREDVGPLPVDIKNGIAKLLDVYFENDEKFGEGFRAEAEIEYPDIHAGQYIKGKKTKQWITFNAENLEDRSLRIAEILKNLGGSILGDGKTANYIKIAEFLSTVTKRTPIYFKFGTAPKDTGVWPWENWYAAIPGYVPSNGTTSSTDQKKTDHSSNGQSMNGNGRGSMQSPMQIIDPEPWSNRLSPPSMANIEYSDNEDLTSVIARAEAKNGAAQVKLSEWAKALGYTDDDLDESASWGQVGEWVRSGNLKGLDSDKKLEKLLDVIEKQKRTITVGQVYTYQPPNKKEGGPRLKGRECRVKAVTSTTATLENLAKKGELFVVNFDDEFLS